MSNSLSRGEKIRRMEEAIAIVKESLNTMVDVDWIKSGTCWNGTANIASDVYYIDIMSPNRVVKRLHDMTDVGIISKHAWGDNQRNQERRIIICTEEIPESGVINIDK